MAIHTDIRYTSVEELYLDPMNPRLGRLNMDRDLPQDEILELMQDWTLDELAVSYLDSGGYWPHEAMLVTEEELYREPRLVVIEGNRRLAALKNLHSASQNNPASRKWRDIAESREAPPELFTRIPYFFVDEREEVEAFLGFRHVTGIKEWQPAEKAEFISMLIRERGLSYVDVMRKIGSKTPTVRQTYISYQLLTQIENVVPDFPEEQAEDRFSVMYLSLRAEGVRQFLGIDIQAEPEEAERPVPEDKLERLESYTSWIFGTKDLPPLFTDSRQVDGFGRILESPDAVAYLERTERPKYEIAYRIAGGDEPEIAILIETAADNVELSLTRIHLYKKSNRIRKAVARFWEDAKQLMTIFPELEVEQEAEVEVEEEV